MKGKLYKNTGFYYYVIGINLYIIDDSSLRYVSIYYNKYSIQNATIPTEIETLLLHDIIKEIDEKELK